MGTYYQLEENSDIYLFEDADDIILRRGCLDDVTGETCDYQTDSYNTEECEKDEGCNPLWLLYQPSNNTIWAYCNSNETILFSK